MQFTDNINCLLYQWYTENLIKLCLIPFGPNSRKLAPRKNQTRTIRDPRPYWSWFELFSHWRKRYLFTMSSSIQYMTSVSTYAMNLQKWLNRLLHRTSSIWTTITLPKYLFSRITMVRHGQENYDCNTFWGTALYLEYNKLREIQVVWTLSTATLYFISRLYVLYYIINSARYHQITFTFLIFLSKA